MSNSKTKTIFFNNQIIGEINTTGDDQLDIVEARKLLNSKGLLKKPSLTKSMFRQACSFLIATRCIHDREIKNGKSLDGLSITPFVVNITFTIELFIKTLAQVHGRTLRGHELVDLYDSLPSEATDIIEYQIMQHSPKFDIDHQIDLRGQLLELNTAFVDWRYIYEKKKTNIINITETILIMECLYLSCRAIFSK